MRNLYCVVRLKLVGFEQCCGYLEGWVFAFCFGVFIIVQFGRQWVFSRGLYIVVLVFGKRYYLFKSIYLKINELCIIDFWFYLYQVVQRFYRRLEGCLVKGILQKRGFVGISLGKVGCCRLTCLRFSVDICVFGGVLDVVIGFLGL